MKYPKRSRYMFANPHAGFAIGLSTRRTSADQVTSPSGQPNSPIIWEL